MLSQPHKITQRLTPEQIEELVEAYRAGETAAALSRQWKISRGTVARLLETRGVELHQRGLSDVELAAAIGLYAAGQSLVVISKQLDQNPSSIRDALVRAGVEMRRPHKLTEEEIRKCVRLYREGWSTVRLGQQFGVGDRTVAKALRAVGAEMRVAGPTRQDGR